MATKSTLLVFFLVSFLLHSDSHSAAYGWWDTGHMLVAQISYTYLSQRESNETQDALQNAFNALLTYSAESVCIFTTIEHQYHHRARTLPHTRALSLVT